jgi:hypothetical protein
MAIESDKSGNIIATGEGVTIFAVLSLRARLKMELRGLRGPKGRSAMNQLKDLHVVPEACRSKEKAIEHATAWLEERKPAKG